MNYNQGIRMDICIKTTPAFDRKAAELMSTEALEELYNHIRQYPELGQVIRGTGGVRKLHWQTGKNNKGKSGGVRILYHYSMDLMIILITLYSKSVKDDISEIERNKLKQMIPLLLNKYRGDI